MKVHWWGCVWGLLCIPAEVIQSTWTVTVNSSTEIVCSTSVSEPMGVYLQRGFHDNQEIMFLHIENGQVMKKTTSTDFAGRIHVSPDQQMRHGHGFTWQVSLLRLEDTNWYYCRWIYLKSKALEQETSVGTIIIVRENNREEQCKKNIWDPTFIGLSMVAFIALLFLIIGAVIVRRTKFKRHFRPARAAKTSRPPRPPRPRHVCPQQRDQHLPYLVTSVNARDIKVIL